jgi:PhzF family phenazine biosynthesis protein
MEIYQVDAFTENVFSGNPAAVIPVAEWPEANVMQKIAAENNLSETAFYRKNEDSTYSIRWFTPETEVDLCGHATLATAHVLFHHKNYQHEEVTFHSNSGDLMVSLKEGRYTMNFPSNKPDPIPVPKLLPEAIGVIPLYTGVNTDLLVLIQDEKTVSSMKPDLLILKKMEVRGIIITAPSESEDYDFVSRFFAPSVGVSEDPVTGSAHTVLTPFWAKRLGKNKLKARQISSRGGDLYCEDLGERTEIGGYACTYMIGEISI